MSTINRFRLTVLFSTAALFAFWAGIGFAANYASSTGAFQASGASASDTSQATSPTASSSAEFSLQPSSSSSGSYEATMVLFGFPQQTGSSATGSQPALSGASSQSGSLADLFALLFSRPTQTPSSSSPAPASSAPTIALGTTSANASGAVDFESKYEVEDGVHQEVHVQSENGHSEVSVHVEQQANSQ